MELFVNNTLYIEKFGKCTQNTEKWEMGIFKLERQESSLEVLDVVVCVD